MNTTYWISNGRKKRLTELTLRDVCDGVQSGKIRRDAFLRPAGLSKTWFQIRTADFLDPDLDLERRGIEQGVTRYCLKCDARVVATELWFKKQRTTCPRCCQRTRYANYESTDILVENSAPIDGFEFGVVPWQPKFDKHVQKLLQLAACVVLMGAIAMMWQPAVATLIALTALLPTLAIVGVIWQRLMHSVRLRKHVARLEADLDHANNELVSREQEFAGLKRLLQKQQEPKSRHRTDRGRSANRERSQKAVRRFNRRRSSGKRICSK